MSDLHIRLLGRFEVVDDGRRARLATRRTEALFAYLVATGSPHSRDHLAELLWDAQTAGKAAGNLRVLLTNLRRGVGAYVDIQRSHVAFRPPEGVTVHVDALDFGAGAATLLTAGAADVQETDSETIRRVLDVYSGDFLAHLDVPAGTAFDDWLLLERQNLAEQRVSLLRLLVEAELAGARTAAALSESARLLAIDPLHEGSHQLRIRAHVQAGDLASAVHQFEALETMLQREFGAKPSPSSRGLLAAAPAVTRNGTTVLPSGHRRASSTENHPRPLWSRFVDRRSQLAAIAKAYGEAAEGRGGCVVVAGESGRGKTLLLRHAVRMLVDRDPAAVVLGGQGSDLTHGGSGNLLIANIAAQLNGDGSGPWLDSALPAQLADRLPDASVGLGCAGDAPGGLKEVASGIRSLAAVRPVILTLGDLQHVGAEVATLVADLVTDIRHRQLVVLCSVRSEAMVGPAASPVVERLLARINRHASTTWVDLDAVSEQDARSFVNQLVDSEPNDLPSSFREELLRNSDGLPVLAVDHLRDLARRGQLVADASGRLRTDGPLMWSAVPARTARLLDERLAAVPSGEMRILRAAAVMGVEFSAASVAAATGRDLGDVIEALSRVLGRQLRLIEPLDVAETRQSASPARYRFRRQALRQHVLADLDPWEEQYVRSHVAVGLADASATPAPQAGLATEL